MFENSAKICFKLSRDLMGQSNSVLLNVFPSDFLEITSCVYTKIIILFNLDEQWL